MKKRFVILCFTILTSVTMVSAWERPGFEWSLGADITTAYLYRGMNYGGLAFQPEVSIGYAGVALTAWANLSPEDYTFSAFAPELDITLSYSIVGITVGATHQYYFDGSKYFDFKGEGTTQTEVFGEFALGDLVEKVPLTIGWYTFVAGDDFIPETGQRAYSSYAEISFEGVLPLGFSLIPTVGITPWKSCYTNYEGEFALNNVSLKLNWEWEVGEHFCLDVYAIGMINTYGITKENLIPEIANSYANQRLNGAIGLGLWLY